MDLIEIFKAGTHTDSSGKTREWTDKDLQEIASLYDPANHEAPIVIGHPDTDSPAYGWVESLKAEGGKLLASLKDVAPEFKDWFKRGLYKKVSVALYPDLGLRHIGFLGATPPAVKGLKQAIFSEKAAWIIEEDVTQGFSSDDPNKPPIKNIGDKGGKKMDVSKLLSDLKAFIVGAEKELIPDPDRKFTEADIQAKVKEAKDLAFAEMEKLKKEKADLEKEKGEAAARTKEIEDKARKDGIAAFCEALCKEGKLTPALRKIIEPVMIAVSVGDGLKPSDVIEFAEGVKKSALDGIKDFLTEIPKVVTFKEVAGGEGPNSGGSAAEKLSALTKKKMEGNKDLSYGSAFSEVQKENPELAREIVEEMKSSREKK